MNTLHTVPQIRIRSHLRAGEGGGYIGGIWYPDRSGTCAGGTPPPTTPPPTQPPPGQGGGYIGGVWYPDKSGACG